MFEPGEGWMYGASIDWTARFVSKLTRLPLDQYIQNHIFDLLSMTCSTLQPEKHSEICSKRLPMVMRDRDSLLPVENEPGRELISSVSDVLTLLADLMSSSSKLLTKESIDLVFAPQFAPSSTALSCLRQDIENYAAPAGIPTSTVEAPVNHTLAALLVEEELPLSHIPSGTVTWNGMPNVIWAMNREKGLAMMFATQLLPVDDKKTVDLAMAFMKGAWSRFG